MSSGVRERAEQNAQERVKRIKQMNERSEQTSERRRERPNFLRVDSAVILHIVQGINFPITL